MNCYLSRNYKGTSNAGNKAKTDIEQVMESMAFKNVGLKQTTHTNKFLHFIYTLAGVLKSPFCLHAGDKLVLQYPFKKYFTFVCKLAHARGAKVIVVIHDLGSFRRKALSVKQEIERLNHTDLILCHQIQDECLHGLRFGAPVEKVTANDQLVGFGIVEKALFGQYGLQFGKKGMYIGNDIVFDKAHSLVAV